MWWADNRWYEQGSLLLVTTCTTCRSEHIEADDFRDGLSRREFTISHMCQECQDHVFKEFHIEGTS